MGKEVNIFLLAKKMINLSGLEYKNIENPKGDIEIEITGLKEGEKLSEKHTRLPLPILVLTQ